MGRLCRPSAPLTNAGKEEPMSREHPFARSVPSNLLTLDETSDRLRKSAAQLRWMIHRGGSHAPKSALIGGRRMFRESDVEAWIAEQFEKESA